MPKRKKSQLVTVQFLVGNGLFNAGEKAGFTPKRAKELIEGGVAAEPGVIAKVAAAAKAATDRKMPEKEPEVGGKVSFFVDRLGDVEGTVTAIPASGPLMVDVGEGDDVDHYEVERSEITVVEET
jgi:hypothetical protein